MKEQKVQIVPAAQVVPAVEVLDEPVLVWVIASGEYAERTAVAVVHGTEADAQRCAADYNATVPWNYEADRAHVWAEVPFIVPKLQG